MTDNEVVFAALGGVGEIGMNFALYGIGPADDRRWIIVDCGVSFAGPDIPGVDIMVADTRFIEEERGGLQGIFITHAHEDHYGALGELWPRLRCPVYMTKFAAGLYESKRAGNSNMPEIDIRIVEPKQPVNIAPFTVEFISMAHSIPETNALAIGTPLGKIVHTGDWKIDEHPGAGLTTDLDRLGEIGKEGVLAMVADSTNAMREGKSESEAQAAEGLKEVIANAKGRVAVTSFSSNLARIRAIALAAQACGREVIVAGRSLDRVINVAQENGYIEPEIKFHSVHAYRNTPRDKCVLIITGSQGEDRAALARISRDDHPDIKLAKDDTVVFSARTIPGNERPVIDIMNRLVKQGIKIITANTHMVHVSGHPRRDEMKMLIELLNPKILIPAHGEPMHLTAHSKFASEIGVPHVIRAFNGDVVHLGPNDPSIIDEIPSGLLLKDGKLLIEEASNTIHERRRLSIFGMVSASIVIDEKGNVLADPLIDFSGLPELQDGSQTMEDVLYDAVESALAGLHKNRKADPDYIEGAVARAVRNQVGDVWGKRPAIHVLVNVV